MRNECVEKYISLLPAASVSWGTIFTGRNIKNKVTCRAILWWTFPRGEYSHLTTTFSMYLHAVLLYIWKSFSEGNEELQERAESQQTLENQSAEEEAIIYLQEVRNAICNGKIGFLHSWAASMTSLIWLPQLQFCLIWTIMKLQTEQLKM